MHNEEIALSQIDVNSMINMLKKINSTNLVTKSKFSLGNKMSHSILKMRFLIVLM